MRIAVAVLVFAVVFLFVFSVFMLAQTRHRYRRNRKLKALRAARFDAASPLTGLRPAAPAPGVLRHLLGRYFPLGPVEALLAAADAPLGIERFLSICLGAGIFMLLLSALVSRHPLSLLLFLALGLCLPVLFLVHLRRLRETALVRQLPDAIDMIVRALRAGQSLDAALAEVGRSMPAPVGAEIRTIYDEMAMGLPFETAVRNFEGRFDRVADVKILCSSLIVQRETGGNLTRILAGLSRTIRERFKLRMQVRALTAEGRLSTVVLALIPAGFAALTWLLNPDYISLLLVHPLGQKLLLSAAVLDLLGFYVMRRMVRLRV